MPIKGLMLSKNASLTLNSEAVETSAAESVIFETTVQHSVIGSDVSNNQRKRIVFVHRDSRGQIKSEFSLKIDVIKCARSLPVDVCIQFSFTWKLDRLSSMHRAVIVTIRLR